MKNSIFINLVLLLAVATQASFVGDFKPKTWQVNLDRPPAERWPFAEMVPVYHSAMHRALKIINVFIPEWFTPAVKDIALKVLPHLEADYQGEIRAGAKYMGFELSDVVLLNILYEAEAGCTSIVAQDPQNHIVHGRNLDFPLASVLRDLAIHVEFQSNGTTLFNCTTYAGYIGLTGMKTGSFAVSLDQRQSGYIVENLLEALLVDGTAVTSFMLREVLHTQDTFQDALDAIVNTPLAAPSYIILSGTEPGEGTVITRGRNGPADLWSLDAESGRWFLVETNYDHWKPAGDHRRETANKKMNSIGRGNITLNAILDTLSTPPVLNDATTYTTLMSARTGAYENFVRTYPN